MAGLADVIDLGLTGRTVRSVVALVDGVLLVLDGDTDLSIEGSMDVRSLPGPDSDVSFLVGESVVAALADETSGTLDLTMSSGLRVVVPPDPDYESWHLMEPHTFTGCMPGGGLM